LLLLDLAPSRADKVMITLNRMSEKTPNAIIKRLGL
jgi:hypothetical protein